MEEESWLTRRDAQHLNWQGIQNGNSCSAIWPVEKLEGANKNIMRVHIYVSSWNHIANMVGWCSYLSSGTWGRNYRNLIQQMQRKPEAYSLLNFFFKFSCICDRLSFFLLDLPKNYHNKKGLFYGAACTVAMSFYKKSCIVFTKLVKKLSMNEFILKSWPCLIFFLHSSQKHHSCHLQTLLTLFYSVFD